METKEIISGNKLIVESIFSAYEGDVKGKKMSDEFYSKILKYHESYDWIMPVVEAVRDSGFQIQLLAFKQFGMPKRNSENGFRINKGQRIVSFKDESNNMKMAIWRAIVSFIEWYNEEKLNNTYDEFMSAN